MPSNFFFKTPGCFHIAFRGGLVVHVQVQGEVVTDLSADLQGRHRGVDLQLTWLPLQSTLGFLRQNTGPCAVSHVVTFADCLEDLLQVQAPSRARLFRLLLCESERVVAHLLTLGRIARCMGILPLFSYMYQFRKQVARISKKLWGTTRPQDLIILGGCRLREVPQEHLDLWCDFFQQEASPLVQLAETLLLKNPIFKERASGLGLLSPSFISEMGLSGPTARASGVPLDARSWGPSSLLYKELGFAPTCLSEGDVLARVRIRLDEVNPSINLLKACCQKFPATTGMRAANSSDLVSPSRLKEEPPLSISALEEPLSTNQRQIYCGESPNGEFSVFAVGDENRRLRRCRLQPPSFKALQAFEKICIGQNITDLEMLQLSLDIRIGELVG